MQTRASIQTNFPSRQLGKGRIENIVMIVFISGLMGYFIVILLNVIESVESIAIDTRIKQLQSATKWKFSEMQMLGKQNQILDLQGANPFEWIDFGAFDNEIMMQLQSQKKVDENKTAEIESYLGSFEQIDWSLIPQKKWLYDQTNGVIMYKLAYPDAIEHMGLVKDQLQWKVEVQIITEANPFAAGTRQRAEGLKLVPVFAYGQKN